MAKIDIEINHEGKIKAIVREEKGTKCTKFIPLIEEMLGAKIYELQYTDEYNVVVTVEASKARVQTNTEVSAPVEEVKQPEEIITPTRMIIGQ